MFSLSPRTWAKSRPAAPSRVRLGLEALEDRYCPTTTVGLTQHFIGPAVQRVASAMCTAPTLTLNLTWGANRSVTFSGTVTDANSTVAGLTVVFSSNADGTFQVTVTALTLGVVSAQVTDELDMESNVAQVTLSNTTPVIKGFHGSEGAGNVWTFSGSVTDNYAPGMTVTLGGIASLNWETGVNVTVKADGTFSYTLRLNGTMTDNGVVWADTTDWWGATAKEVSWNVYQVTGN